MATDEKTSRREYYRVTVPESEYVTLKTDDAEYRVVEISENGIRFESNSCLPADEWVRGTIFYGQGESIQVTSQVLRCDKGKRSGWEIVVSVLNLMMPDVVAFQSYLVRRYGLA